MCVNTERERLRSRGGRGGWGVGGGWAVDLVSKAAWPQQNYTGNSKDLLYLQITQVRIQTLVEQFQFILV